MEKTVVITGATSGMGKLLAETFAKNGYKVFAGYRNVELKNSLIEISENIIPFRLDMTKKWTIDEAAKFICENTEHIDTLINAAGCVVAGPMENIGVDRIKEQFEVNTFGHVDFTQKLLPRFENTKVFNISSMASFGIFPFVAPYCASKRALDILFNSMQLECQGKEGGNFTVISIKPGVIKTPLWSKSIEINKNFLDDAKYQAEANYLIQNAKDNEENGLDPQKVVDLIVKVNSLNNPKPSYTVGIDAKIAEIVSKLPQWLQNKLVKLSMDKKFS